MPLDGGEARSLTDLPLGVFDPRWLPDGSGIVFAATDPHGTSHGRGDRAPSSSGARRTRSRRTSPRSGSSATGTTWLTTGEVPHLFLYDLASGGLRDLTPESTLWFDWMEPGGSYDISPDGTEIACRGHRLRRRALARALGHLHGPGRGRRDACLTADHPARRRRRRATVAGRRDARLRHAARSRLLRRPRAAHGLRPCGAHAREPLLEQWDLLAGPLGRSTRTARCISRPRTTRASSLFAWTGAGEPASWSCAAAPCRPAAAAGRAVLHLADASSSAARGATCRRASGQDARAADALHRAAIGARIGTGEVREMRFEGAYGETVQMFVVLPPATRQGRRIRSSRSSTAARTGSAATCSTSAGTRSSSPRRATSPRSSTSRARRRGARTSRSASRADGAIARTST